MQDRVKIRPQRQALPVSTSENLPNWNHCGHTGLDVTTLTCGSEQGSCSRLYLTSPSQSALYWKVSFSSGKSYCLTRTGLAQKEPTEATALKDSLGKQPQHVTQPHAHSFQRTFRSPTLTYPQQTMRVTQQSKRASNREERSQNKNTAQLGNSIYAERRL